MKLVIPYQQMELIPYEGAGNKTPVLDISCVEKIAELNPIKVRECLENDYDFRIWLRAEGKKLQADSIMIFYKAFHSDYEFVTFIGEPNAPLESDFSTMCGNGIRSLAIHIVSSEKIAFLRQRYLHEGLHIWAGGKRNIRIISFDESSHIGSVHVDLGPFRNSKNDLSLYTNLHFKNIAECNSLSLPHNGASKYLESLRVGIGYNGDEDGEPHLVILTRWDEYLSLLQRTGYFEVPSSAQEILYSLRKTVCLLGRELTFLYKFFPQGINVNLALVLYDEIFMSTHERNLSSGKAQCLLSELKNQFCICNTMACGTGGAAVSNIARLQGFISSAAITTHHPGGSVDYIIEENQTSMIGPAKRIVTFNSGMKYL